MRIGDHIMVAQAPVLRVAMGTGDGQEDAHKLVKEKVEKRWTKKGKNRGRQRKANGWCTQLASCFGCGAASQDEEEEQEEDRVIGREETRKAYEACRQRFKKIMKEDQRRKEAYKKIQRSRMLVEANRKWSALPLKSEEAKRNVSFLDVNHCCIWYFEEEEVPSQMCLKWARILEEMRQSAMERAALDEWEKENNLLRQSEENQRILLRQKAPANHSNPYKALVFFMLLIGYLVYLWLCSLRYGAR